MISVSRIVSVPEPLPFKVFDMFHFGRKNKDSRILKDLYVELFVFFQGAMNKLFFHGNRHKNKEDLGEFSPWRSSVSRWLLPRIEFHFSWEWQTVPHNGGKVWVKALENASNCSRRGFFETNETNWEAVGLAPRAWRLQEMEQLQPCIDLFLGSYWSCYWNSLYGSNSIL